WWLNYNNLIAKDMRLISGRYFMVSGQMHFVFLIYALVYFIIGCLAIIKKFRKSAGLHRLQLKYVILAIVLAFSIGIFTNIIFPLLAFFFPAMEVFNRANLFGPILPTLFIVTTSYAILKHRLLDIEIVISRSAGYMVAAPVVIIFYGIFVIIAEIFLRDVVGYNSFIVTAMAAVSIALIFHPIQKKVQDYVYNKFFAGRFIYQKLLLDASRQMITKLNLEELLSFILEIIQSNVRTARVAFLLRQEERVGSDIELFYYLRSQRGVDPNVARKFQVRNGLINWFNDTREVFVRDEMEIRMAEKGFSELYGNLHQIGAEILVPVFIKDKLEGILSIDRKEDGGGYSQSDIDILNILSAQLAVGIENVRLYGEAITDELTGLFNRRYFDYRLKEEILRSRRYKRSLALLIIDIDNFKAVNDKYGHQAGDMVLNQLSEFIRAGLRQVDIVCRYGGDEISIILPETGRQSLVSPAEENKNISGPLVAAERIRSNIEKHIFIFGDENIKVSVSIGLVYIDDWSKEGISPEEIIGLADRALYRAKSSGRNCVME
ncbi:MAG: diguanylate cyclase, partial [Candidatus Omnitrophica bacterium]|nr:diguanylate cyclase [Candidatus Omnitrophota bacterium]